MRLARASTRRRREFQSNLALGHNNVGLLQTAMGRTELALTADYAAP